MKNDNLPDGYIPASELQNKILQENIKHIKRENANKVLTTVLCILFFPITLIIFLIIGLGTSKD